MKVVVCVRQGIDGELSPFDASAYEAALRLAGAEVTLLSMGPLSTKDFLLRLTRLGAKRAILLCDKKFAGADTLATAYALSLAVKKLEPQLVFCGRQTLVGDTGQTGPMLSVMSGRNLICNVMCVEQAGDRIVCATRQGKSEEAVFPALLTLERIHDLRLPSILSRPGQVEVWDAEAVCADPEKCGLKGSPTRVLESFENQTGKRKCRFISWEELPEVIAAAKQKNNPAPSSQEHAKTLSNVCIVGEAPRDFAQTVSEYITYLPFAEAEELAQAIQKETPSAVLWGSDDRSKEQAAKVSAMLGLGLCADCTRLKADGDTLIMYRPALAGTLIAKIVSRTRPAMATVRTEGRSGDVVVTAGWGVRNHLEAVQAFADSLGAELAASRKMVDSGALPYALQVGLTGKTVSPPVYIAVGVSGAVHHIAGMERCGTVIAINPDKDAPIFQYADYGILEEFSGEMHI